MFNAGRDTGESPGYMGVCPTGVGFAPVPSLMSQTDSSVRCATMLSAVDDPSGSVVAPTMEEMCEALSMASTVDMQSSADCFRVLFYQNSVIIRDAICHRRLLSRNSSGRSSVSSLTVSGESSGGSSDSQKKPKLSPPQVFCCPVCPAQLNEKDFGRHVKDWPDKVGKRVPSGHCPGIQDVNHPLLSRFPGNSLLESVSACSAYFKSLVRPGAYDSLRPEGSGRHIIVAQRISELMQP